MLLARLERVAPAPQAALAVREVSAQQAVLAVREVSAQRAALAQRAERAALQAQLERVVSPVRVGSLEPAPGHLEELRVLAALAELVVRVPLELAELVGPAESLRARCCPGVMDL